MFIANPEHTQHKGHRRRQQQQQHPRHAQAAHSKSSPLADVYTLSSTVHIRNRLSGCIRRRNWSKFAEGTPNQDGHCTLLPFYIPLLQDARLTGVFMQSKSISLPSLVGVNVCISTSFPLSDVAGIMGPMVPILLVTTKRLWSVVSIHLSPSGRVYRPLWPDRLTCTCCAAELPINN